MGETKTESVIPILRCISEAARFAGSSRVVSVTEQQRSFLKRFVPFIKESDSPFVDGLADKDAEVINSWLKDKGFDIRLENTSGGGFSVASVLDVLVEWAGEASASNLLRHEKTYPAVKLSNGADMCRLADGNFFLRLKTKSDVFVNIAMTGKPDLSDWGIHSAVKSIENKKATSSAFSVDVFFPMISFDECPDISFLRGMKTGGFFVDKAVQQNRFRMNEKGARAQSAAAMTCRSMSFRSSPVIWINEPFLLWITETGKDLPLFCGWFDEDSWKEPSDLNQAR